MLIKRQAQGIVFIRWAVCSLFAFSVLVSTGWVQPQNLRLHREQEGLEILLKALFLSMEQLQLGQQTMILFVLLWTGGLPINVTMELVAGAKLLFLTW